MKTTTKQRNDYVIELTVTLDGSDLKDYLEQARRQLASGLSVDGFRKGMVPDDVARKHLTDEQVRQAALELAVEGSFSNAVREQGWDVAKTEGLNVTKNDAEELSYHISVSVWPTVPLQGLAEIKIPVREVTVTDEQVQEALDTLRNMKASFLDKEGVVADGDRVEIDFTSTVDGKPIPGGDGKGYPLIVGGKSFLPGFEEQLVGLRKGDSKSFDVKAPDDYARSELAGKTVSFAVTIGSVQIVMRPEVDDEFAVSLKYENADALKEAARSSVAAQERTKERDRVRLAIMDEFLSKSDVPAPGYLVDEELDRMVQRFEQDLAGRGLSLDIYLSRLGKSRDEIREQWKSEAQRQVRMSLVVRQVVKERGITADPSVVEATMKDTLERFSGEEGFAAESVDQEMLRRTVQDRLVTEQALAYLERECSVSTA